MAILHPLSYFGASGIALLFGISLVATPLNADEKPKTSKQVLFEQVVTLPDKKVNAKVRRVTFPAGYKTPEHTHKGPGPRYVIKGKVEIVEGGETHTYSAGEVFWESGLPMTAENIGSEELELIIFELLPVE